MIVLLLFLAGTALVLGYVASLLPSSRRERDAQRWATSEGVALDGTTTPVVEGYLRTSRHLRQVGFVGGLLVAPAITAGTGVDLGLPGLLWALIGYLLGCLWAELALTRRPGSTRRTASLAVRQVGDYLPRSMAMAQVGAGVVAVALAIAAVAVDATAVDPWDAGWTVGEDAADLRRSAILAGLLVPAAMAAVALAQRRIVRRAQPLQSPDHIAVDDAMRSSAVRLLGATGIAMATVLVALQVAWMATAAGGEVAAVAGSIASLVLLLGLLQWRWWPHRGWRVRRRGRTTSTAPGEPATAGAPRA